MNYREQYKDPRWQKKRLEILQRDEWQCKLCSTKEETLHVHHRYYLSGTDIWDYPNTAFATLCESCHETESQELKEYTQLFLEQFLSRFWADDLRELAYGFSCLPATVYKQQLVISGLSTLLAQPNILDDLLEAYYERVRMRRAQWEAKQKCTEAQHGEPHEPSLSNLSC